MVDSPAAECDGYATGILIFAETSEFHRIAASTIFDTPTDMEISCTVELTKLKGKEIVRKLANELDPPRVVDEYLLDQLVIFMALATSGRDPRHNISSPRKRRRCEILIGQMSTHAQTAIRIAEIMLGNIRFRSEYSEGVGLALVCEQIPQLIAP
jgi:hypothetical protein